MGALKFELPEHLATDIKARCTPKFAGDIHLIKTQPHMHARGVRLDMIVECADRSRETLIDVPYDFSNQITCETDMVLKPGDSLVTTCHVQNDTDRLIKERSSNANTVDDGGIGF